MVTYKLLSEVGERDNNEDYIGMKEVEGSYCFVLCDGLGGHGKGEVASQLVVEETLSFFEQFHEDSKWMEKALQNAQDSLRDKQAEMHEIEGMKTTVVVLYIHDSEAYWGYVGDSRAYYFKKSKYKFHSLDHSVPQMLVAAREIKEKEIRNHPDRNRLLRVMGMEWESPKYEIGARIDIAKKSHAFLLCSDGFWELIEEKDMQDCLKKSISVDEWISLMQQIVLANGTGTGMDNYSAIGVIIDGGL